ncbi:cystathionine beta-synthase [Candidatus Micrarchaeota archaeon]|nr:cystathionine beta-synthase [Candidatus Micrarchaeota archaeon]
MEYYNNVLEAIGNTPLVKLNRVNSGLKPLILTKVEFLNPGGSVKDRIGFKMIEDAEKRGLLKPGGTIVEPTSGNTGVGLALVAALKGYKTVFVMPDKMSQEKIQLLKAYGADVVVTPTAVDRYSPESYYMVAERLSKELPNAYLPNQYFNLKNPEAHYLSTGPEIWKQTDGKITHFVAGMGTGGTISGVAKYLKEKNPNIKVIGVDSEGSIYSGDKPRPYKVEGIGEDFIPGTIDLKLVDRIVRVTDHEAFLMTRKLAREEGLLAGGSSGAAVFGALQVARELTEKDIMVVLLPDTGRNYLNKIYNDDWMRENGFLEYMPIGDLLYKKQLTQLIAVSPNEKVEVAIELMRKHDVSQLPVIENDRQVGKLVETNVLRLFREHSLADKKVKDIMDKPFPELQPYDSIDKAYKLLTQIDAIVVSSGTKPLGVITKIDLIDYMFKR